MRKSINARIVGHRLFTPDPKNAPKVELLRVEVEFAPLKEGSTDKNSKGVLLAPKDQKEDLQLGQYLRISIEDTQQVLPLARAGKEKAKERARRENPELH